MNKLKRVVVITDLGGTIVDEKNPEFGMISSDVLSEYGISIEQAVPVLSAIVNDLFKENMKPSIEQLTSTSIIEEFLANNNISLSVEQIEKMAWSALGAEKTNYLTPLTGAIEFLKEIKETNADIIALSNTALTLNILNMIFERFDIKKFFKSIILSSECGYKKPATQIYDYLEKNENLVSDDLIIMVGNDYNADITPALKRGYKTVLITEESSINAADNLIICRNLPDAKEAVLKEINLWREANEKSVLA